MIQFDTPAAGDHAVVVGDLEGATAAALLVNGWTVTLVRLDGREMGASPAALSPITAIGDSLPLPEASADLIVLVDALEYAIDDTALLLETGRVLKPGGTLLVRAPRQRRADWLDARNIYHYLRETTRRGAPLPEMGDGIFRRHYATEELAQLLAEAGFALQQTATNGFGASELVYLVGATLFRWADSSHRIDHARRLYGRLDRAESGWAFGGYYLTAHARRA